VGDDAGGGDGAPPTKKQQQQQQERRRSAKSITHSLLPLRDAYRESPPPWGPSLRASYRNGRLLDFVWCSPAVELLRTMPVSELASSSQPKQVPSAAMPSDHLPIGALLSWAGAPEPSADESHDRPAWQQLVIENVQQQKRVPPRQSQAQRPPSQPEKRRFSSQVEVRERR